MKQKEPNLKSFAFTSSTWHEVSQKIDLIVIEDLCNKHLKLSNYGMGVQQIVFLYMAFKPDSKMQRLPVKRFIKKSKMIELSLPLNYTQLFEANKAETQWMMGKLYLKSIKIYPELGVENFETLRFYKDVKRLFEEYGWLPKPESILV